MPLLSRIAQKKRIDYFLKDVPKDNTILEIGCGSGWVGKYFKENGWKNYTGMDLFPPADIVGDILDWKKLGINGGSFDVIVAFEVVEHVDCINECIELLKDNGKLMITTPYPSTDWILKIMEFIGLNQLRTSPHSNLINLKKVSGFKQLKFKNILYLGQWAIFTK